MTDVQEQIGFDSQGALAGNCAQRSLIHALLLLGIPISDTIAHRRTGVGRFVVMFKGTTESALTKAIHRSGCIASLHETTRATEARTTIDQFLVNGMPVIVNVDSEHWFVLSGKQSRDEYYWIDSSEYPIVGCDDWEQIQEWMDSEDRHYVFIGVRPADDRQLDHSIVKDFGRVSDLWDDEELAEWWGYYLEDLTEMFDCPSEGPIIQASEFFERYGEEVVDAVDYAHGFSDRNLLKWEMGNYVKVAKAHKLTLSEEARESALIGISVALTFLA
jgi:hypothetical protein